MNVYIPVLELFWVCIETEQNQKKQTSQSGSMYWVQCVLSWVLCVLGKVINFEEYLVNISTSVGDTSACNVGTSYVVVKVKR
jgi:hypothetical protein